MKCAFTAGLIIQPIEERSTIANVVVRIKLRCVEKPSAPEAFYREKVAKLRCAKAEAEIASPSAEIPEGPLDIPEDPPRSKAGTSRDLRDEAAFIAKLRTWRPGGYLHALDGANGKLSGEYLALLIANWLPVDDEAGLSMVAQGVEQSISVSGYTSRAIRDRLAQSAGRVEGRQFQHQTSVDVDVGGGIVF